MRRGLGQHRPGAPAAPGEGARSCCTPGQLGRAAVGGHGHQGGPDRGQLGFAQVGQGGGQAVGHLVNRLDRLDLVGAVQVPGGRVITGQLAAIIQAASIRPGGDTVRGQGQGDSTGTDNGQVRARLGPVLVPPVAGLVVETVARLDNGHRGQVRRINGPIKTLEGLDRVPVITLGISRAISARQHMSQGIGAYAHDGPMAKGPGNQGVNVEIRHNKTAHNFLAF